MQNWVSNAELKYFVGIIPDDSDLSQGGKDMDKILLREAQRRMKNYDPKDSMTHEEIMREFGITNDELDEIEVDVED